MRREQSPSWTLSSQTAMVRRYLSQFTGNPHILIGTWTLTQVTPISAKRAMVRALMDRAENVCSDPEILAKEVEHLSKVLCYNNYPQWMIDK